MRNIFPFPFVTVSFRKWAKQLKMLIFFSWNSKQHSMAMCFEHWALVKPCLPKSAANSYHRFLWPHWSGPSFIWHSITNEVHAVRSDPLILFSLCSLMVNRNYFKIINFCLTLTNFWLSILFVWHCTTTHSTANLLWSNRFI